MPRSILVPTLAAAAAFVLIARSGRGVAADDAAKPPATAAEAAQVESSRAPDASERAAMLELLKAETAPGRAAWFAYGAGDGEGKALAEALAGVFREAGWKVQSEALTGMVLKPGVSMLMADEQPPTWAETALQAMEASGIEVKSATGYRPYYEEKKSENPSWPGIPLDSDQVFVIVLGPAAKV
jgi:hypothetical protein